MRISLFLALSCALHIGLLFCMPSLSASPEQSLKKPIWVELVDLPSPRQEPSVNVIEQQQVNEDALPSDRKTRRKSIPDKSKKEALTPPDVKPPPEKTLTAPVLDPRIPTATEMAALHSSTDSEESFGGLARNVRQSKEEIEYEKYILEIKTRVLELKRNVEENWADSLNEELREGTTVILAFVDEDGSLWSIDILKPSGIILHDYEALEAVKKVFPLRSPPKTLLNETNKLPIRFEVSYLIHSPLQPAH